MKTEEKKKWIITIAFIILVLIGLYLLYVKTSDRITHPAVQEYVPDAQGMQGDVDTAYLLAHSKDFVVGATKEGMAVFKDPYKAMETLKQQYAPAIDSIRKEFHLQPLNHGSFSDYKTYGWQVSLGDPAEKENCLFVSQFLDIYENSFE